MSTDRSAPMASATKLIAPAVVDTSATRGTAPRPTSAAASSIRPLSRPHIATRTPSLASALADASPKPDEAAATAAVRPEMPSFIGSTLSFEQMVTVESVEAVQAALTAHNYLADEGLATAVFLAIRLHRPLLLEGEAGVGKTELAKVLSAWTGGELVRLQCYEGIDISQAVYEWDYARQLLHVRAAEAAGTATQAIEDELYSERFLVRRPLLQAITDSGDGATPPVLLIDEVDRADDEFEAFLLEILSDYSVTVPELGTFRAAVPPIAIITSNRTRDVHDALKRRCLYHWVEHPDLDREVAIVRARVPGVSERLARQVASAAAAMRERGLYKPPGVAETIDWALALATLGREELTDDAMSSTLGTVVKYREDQERLRREGLGELLAEAVGHGG